MNRIDAHGKNIHPIGVLDMAADGSDEELALRKETACLLGAALMFAASVTYAQSAPSDAIATRVNAYRETGAAFKSINDELKAGTPIKMMMRSSARVIAATAHNQYGWFPAGSGPESGAKTKALPTIWSDPAGFKAAQTRFQQEADLMTKVVETGDLTAQQNQARALGQACGACHNKYRAAD